MPATDLRGWYTVSPIQSAVVPSYLKKIFMLSPQQRLECLVYGTIPDGTVPQTRLVALSLLEEISHKYLQISCNVCSFSAGLPSYPFVACRCRWELRETRHRCLTRPAFSSCPRPWPPSQKDTPSDAWRPQDNDNSFTPRNL